MHLSDAQACREGGSGRLGDIDPMGFFESLCPALVGGRSDHSDGSWGRINVDNVLEHSCGHSKWRSKKISRRKISLDMKADHSDDPLPLIVQNIFWMDEGRTFARNDERIIGGRDALPGEFPFQVSIGYINPETKLYEHNCGGSILDEHHVLTAGHCGVLFNYSMSYGWFVVAGALNVSDPTEKTRVERPIAQLYIHEDFSWDTLQNDVTLIRVEGEFSLDGKVISTIPLRDVTLNPPAECTVSGWGQFTPDPVVSQVLQELDEPLIPQEDCVRIYEDFAIHVLPGMLCSGFLEGGPSACHGDSGGPLVCGGQLTGVVSWSGDCINGTYPAVYADVAYYNEWIQKTLAKSIEDGGL
ncbi:trypsin-4 [Anabrus simplex]|uniref:trypsin-4 n=1 Tax=Anabrus simplex TaxID=316456 RepID=UPI0035A2FCDA